jgi:hypothetical protein
MATAAAIRARIFNNLYGAGHTVRPFAHRINEGAGYTAGDGVVTVDDGTKFTAGDVIEFQSDGMQARVESIATNDLTIEAGINGTTDANQSDNAVIYKNPRFTIKQADDAVTEILGELEGWNIHVFGTGTITLVANQYYYDLTETDIVESIGVLSLYEQEANTLTPLPLPFHYWNNIHATLSTTQHGINVWDKGNTASTGTLYFTYAEQIATTADLLVRQEEIVVLGATARVMGADINPRTMDPGKRTDRTVQPGQTARDSGWFLSMYRDACLREEANLQTEVDRFTRKTRETARVRRWVV